MQTCTILQSVRLILITFICAKGRLKISGENVLTAVSSVLKPDTRDDAAGLDKKNPFIDHQQG